MRLILCLLLSALLTAPMAGHTQDHSSTASGGDRLLAAPLELDDAPVRLPRTAPLLPALPAETQEQPSHAEAAPSAVPGVSEVRAKATPSPAGLPPARPASSSRRLWLTAYDHQGARMDLQQLLAYISRSDSKDKPGGSGGLAVYSADGSERVRSPELLPAAGGAVLVWSGPERVQLGLPWPVHGDGFSTVWIDKRGEGYGDGDTIVLNEEIALDQHRSLQDSFTRRTKEARHPYQPGKQTRKLMEKAAERIADAQREDHPVRRAARFDKTMLAVSLAWQKTLYEHGLQVAHDNRASEGLRFGLTLDETILKRASSLKWLASTIEKSGTNWVRLVFAPNPGDFLYANGTSFAQYDPIVSALSLEGIKIMGSVLDTSQWPRTLTPDIYRQRVQNLVVRYGNRIRSWEVGSELNGDWLGGSRTPLSTERVFEIYAAGVRTVKETDPSLETVATLYWWDGTAPDGEHSLFGWLGRFVPNGFGRDLDVVSLSLMPNDNPVGTAFERIFRRVHELLPDKKLMLGAFGYVEDKKLDGYWWLDPMDVDGARKDLVLLYNAASCAMPNSLCGGFWWQALDQMLPDDSRATSLFLIHRRSLDKLGR